MDVLDYEALVAEFEGKLLTQLRSFGSGAEYLEMWVPDSDPVKSVLNMIEAAEAYGRRELAIRLTPETLRPSQVDQLITQVGELGRVVVRRDPDAVLVEVTDIGSGQ